MTPEAARQHEGPVRLAIALLAAALLYRVVATTGDMLFDPVVYAQNAFNVLQGTFTLKTDSWFSHRLTVFLPVVPLYAVFGVGTWSSVAWPLLASIGQLALVLAFGWKRFGPPAALLATAFLALAPLDVLYSSVLNPDIIIATFMTASMVTWIEAVHDPGRSSRVGLFLSGVFFALAFVTRVFAVILLVSILLHWIWRRPGWKVAIPFGIGALVVFAPIAIAYAVQTGDPLYRLGVVGGRYATALKSEGAQFLYYPSLLLHPRHVITGIAPHIYLFALIGGMLRPTRARLLLLLWALPVLLYLQFGSMSASSYIPILKRERFLLPLSAPLFLLAGDLVWDLARLAARMLTHRRPDSAGALGSTPDVGRSRRLRVGFAAVAVAVVCLASVLVVRDQRAIAAGRVEAFEDVARVVRAWPELPVLCDHWRTGYRLAYYLDFEEGADFYRGGDDSRRMASLGAFGDSRLGYLVWFPAAELLPRSLVVLDDEALAASRAGNDVTQTYRPQEIPGYAHDPPASWRLLGRFGGFRVYFVER